MPDAEVIPPGILRLLGKTRPMFLKHPYNTPPYQSDDEFSDLVASHRGSGQVDAITLYEGKVLDGWHRYLACLVVGLEPKFEEYTGNDPAGLVLARMTHRNLDPSKRGLYAAKLVKFGQKSDGSKYRQEEVRRIADVGETVVLQAKRVLDVGVPELARMIENGQVTVKAAASVAALPKAEQAKVVANGAASVKSKAAQIKRADEDRKAKGVPAQRRKKSDPSPNATTSPAPATDEPPQYHLGHDILSDLQKVTAKITRYLQTSDGKQFADYIEVLDLGWIEHVPTRLTDSGEGLKKFGGSKFVATREIRRLMKIAMLDNVYPAAKLREMMAADEDVGPEGDRAGTVTPPRTTAEEAEMVEPESL